MRRHALVVLFVAFAACGGDDSLPSGADASPDGADASPDVVDGGDTNLTPVGSVSLSRLFFDHVDTPADVAAAASASFYDPYDAPPVDEPAIDTCRIPSLPGETTFVYRDVGPTVTVGSLTLERTITDGVVSYMPSVTPVELEQVQPGERYAVSWPGGPDMGAAELSADDGVRVPPVLQLFAPATGSELGGALDLDWSDDAAEGRLFVSLSGYDTDAGELTSYSCVVEDDGAFTVPAEVIEGLPSGDVTVSLMRYHARAVAVGGGEGVWMSGSYYHSTTVIKP